MELKKRPRVKQKAPSCCIYCEGQYIDTDKALVCRECGQKIYLDYHINRKKNV